MLSNLGRVEDPPWFATVGRGLWFGPPPRSPVILTVGAASAAGRCGISFRWCDAALTVTDVQTFTDLFLNSLSQLQAAAPVGGVRDFAFGAGHAAGITGTDFTS